ncbi:hypothetical protein V7O66_11705 [Methanolobus sp. ZRKC3]|uniref:DUF7289 family protein n=1 Tax=Methanolobus sp. ZRKC3 TaxID=3125786 RepID=UPI0032440A57
MKRITNSESAVSPVIGMLIILALTITSTSIILLYGMPTLSNMEDMANSQKVEQAFTVFDSRTSKVALGESPSQTTSFSIMDGSIKVNGGNASYNESRIVILNVDIGAVWYSGFQNQRYKWGSWEAYSAQPEMSEFNVSMGSITYTKGDRIVGYEGGGIWSKYPNGRSVMISPPEFHYNGETLTLPIMKISGDQVSSGTTGVDITVSSDNMPVVLYPDSSTGRVNPLNSDKILIYIQSEFYTAWADYANSLAYTSAETDDANKTAIIELEVIPAMGQDTLKQAFKVGAVNQSNPAPIYNFSFDLQARASAGLNPSNYQISTSSGTKTLTYTLAKNGGANQLTMTVIYEDAAPGGGVETWTGLDVFPVSGAQDDQASDVDFLNQTFNLEYDENSDFSWNETSWISTLPNVEYENGDVTSLYNLTQHYMRLITTDGSVVFNLDNPGNGKGKGGGSDPVDYDDSSITLYYDGMPGSITYLHVSKNELTASLG